jgi:selenocysteine lyase/cysteine desulfurase
LAAILGYEYGIGVRSGCFCAHPYLLQLLDVTGEEAERTRIRMQAGDKSAMPGLVRMSFGLYNTRNDVDVIVEAVIDIIDGKYQGEYHQDRASGEYYPQGWQPDFDQYFKI